MTTLQDDICTYLAEHNGSANFDDLFDALKGNVGIAKAVADMYDALTALSTSGKVKGIITYKAMSKIDEILNNLEKRIVTFVSNAEKPVVLDDIIAAIPTKLSESIYRVQPDLIHRTVAHLRGRGYLDVDYCYALTQHGETQHGDG